MSRFQLDDPTQEAVNEPRPADEQQALDALLDYEGVAPDLLSLDDRPDTTALLTRDDERTLYEHALDVAPQHSKIVRTNLGAVFATPSGARLLTPYDPANQLPRGAKITKLGEGAYRGALPNDQGTYDTTLGASVIALIAEMLNTIHG